MNCVSAIRNNILTFPLLLLLLSLLFSFQGAGLKKIVPLTAPDFSKTLSEMIPLIGGLERTRTSDLTLIRRAL